MSAVFYYLYNDAVGELKKECGPPPGPCPESARDAYRRGKTYSWLAPTAGVVGVAAIGSAALAWLVTEASTDGPVDTAGMRLRVVSAPRVAGVWLGGAF